MQKNGMRKIRQRLLAILGVVFMFGSAVSGFAAETEAFAAEYSQTAESNSYAGVRTVNYNAEQIAAVGKQGSQMCMAYTLAYCRTILDGRVHAGSEYWKNGTGGMPSWAGYVHSGAGDKQSFLRMIVSQIDSGKPVGMYVTKRYRSNQAWNAPGNHWVCVIGYRSSADLNNLKTSDFYIIDPGGCEYDYLSDNVDSFSYTTSNLLVCRDESVSEKNIIISTSASEITETTAKISSSLDAVHYVSTCGFYWGTSQEHMVRVTENANTNVKQIYYTLGSGKWTAALQPGTTYYYQVFATVGGKEYKGDVCSFRTAGGDTQLPSVTSAYISEYDSTGYTVVATVEDNVGVTKVVFPTKRADEAGDQFWRWYEGVKNADGTWSYRVQVSELENVDGEYQTEVRACDGAGNLSDPWRLPFQYIDTTAPVIGQIEVTDITAQGYKVSCMVTDNQKIDRVQFPTWTVANGQDDLMESWDTNVKASGEINGSQVSYHVRVDDHNKERGWYSTHIYAYDSYGNYTCYVVEDINVEKNKMNFTDVKEGDYFFNPVIWAVEKGITTGIGTTGRFDPNGVCTRAHVVTFLWRQAGCPKPSGDLGISFRDVQKEDYFYDAVMWAAEKEITTGIGATGKFMPHDPCTRAHTVTFLRRAAGNPPVLGNGGTSFEDVGANDYFYESVMWAVENGITGGVGTTGKFMPNNPCTRANAVTFMYRAAEE